MYMNGLKDLDSLPSRWLTKFISRNLKTSRGISREDLPAVEEIVQRHVSWYNFDIQEEEYVGELSQRTIGGFW